MMDATVWFVGLHICMCVQDPVALHTQIGACSEFAGFRKQAFAF